MGRRPKKTTEHVLNAPAQLTYLKAWRKFRGLSQEKLGELTGLSQGRISQLEGGAIDYTGTTLADLASILRCEPIDLMKHDPGDGDSLYTIVGQIPEEDRPQAAAVLKALRTAGRR